MYIRLERVRTKFVLASTFDFSRLVGGVQYVYKNHLLRKTRRPAVFSESYGLFSLAIR